MRISELSATSGVSTATIKYYLREGLLAPGERTSATQAVYGETHVRRLRLIRVLRDVANLPVDAIREVLDAVDNDDRSIHDMLAAATYALGPGTQVAAPEVELDRVDRVVAAMGWQVGSEAPARAHLASTMAALDRLGSPVADEALAFYASMADQIAAIELGFIDEAEGRSAVVEQVVIGTVVYEQVLVAMRRLAEEHHSSTRFA
jgi:DNA-binding transcriptional MerR regulator